MSKTSSAVKNRYNAKTYTRITVLLKKSEYAEYEELKGTRSHAEFMRELLALYKAQK